MKNRGQNVYVPGDIYIFTSFKTSVTGICVSKIFGGLSPNLMKWVNINNCNLKCSFCLGMGHTKDRCWKKNDKGPSTCANFLKKLINDEEATLIKLNQLFGIKHNVFSKIKMPKCKMHVQASTSYAKA
jgi:hypothetical protein